MLAHGKVNINEMVAIAFHGTPKVFGRSTFAGPALVSRVGEDGAIPRPPLLNLLKLLWRCPATVLCVSIRYVGSGRFMKECPFLTWCYKGSSSDLSVCATGKVELAEWKPYVPRHFSSSIAMNAAHVPMLLPNVQFSAVKPRGTGAMLMHVLMKANSA